MLCFSVDSVATGNKIKSLCYQCGYSAADLQRELGLESVQSVYKWYNGKCLPSVDKLLAMEKLFSVPLQEIVISYHNGREAV
jgi:transcriptional regulator with XRE-family HTH domain